MASVVARSGVRFPPIRDSLPEPRRTTLHDASLERAENDLSDDRGLTPRPSAWYLAAMLLALAFVVTPALYGFFTSQADRPLFGDAILEPAREP